MVDSGAALYALAVWWASTGVIILLDNLPRRTFRWSFSAATILFLVSLWRLGESAYDPSLAGVYAAFTYAVLCWGWLEMGFFMGIVTGPRRIGCRPGATLWQRFQDGVAACLHHELAIVATAGVIVALTWGGANQVGWWTFLVLWCMRQSAKLNVFLGVRNLGERFIPPHLTYLLSYMAKRPINQLLPVSVTAGTAAAVTLAMRAAHQPAPAQAAGLTFLVTMLTLAVLEHWMLILPLPFERLWSWILTCRRPSISQVSSTVTLPQTNNGAHHAV